ncbi:MAG TPA: biopolymer transporter ExbD [Alphaproteobacteria bacterium]|nr:biopolymer transporter ExbD [Alphaproteobacteria bacterium]
MGLRAVAWAVLFAALIAISPAGAADQPLTVFIQDGEVLFQGMELDLDQLTEKLKATGRQPQRIYFRMGPNAKTAYTKRVIAAIQAAGFTDIAVMPPPGLDKKEPEAPL